MLGRARSLSLLLLAVGGGLAAAGCGHTVTEGDCAQIQKNMREAWDAEAKKAAPDGPGGEKASAVVKAEGERLAADWTAECRKDLVNRRVDPAQMSCLF